MNARHSIIGYILGFLSWCMALVVLAYVLIGINGHSEAASPAYTTFIIGGAVLLAIIGIPVFFLKKLSKLSRHVQKDDSRFSVAKITDHQERPRIQYY